MNEYLNYTMEKMLMNVTIFLNVKIPK